MQKEFEGVNYLDLGEGPAILFGHSFMWDSAMWKDQVKELSQNFRCIVPELWGHGQSDDLPKDINSFAEIAKFYHEIMQSLNINEYSVVGLSVGGMWGAHSAIEFPESVKKLVLMNTDLGAEPAKKQALYFHLLDIVKAAGCVPQAVIDAIAANFFSPKTVAERPEELEAFIEKLKSWPSDKIDSMVALGKIIFSRPNDLEALKEIKADTLIVAGADDVYRPIHESEAMNQAIPKSELVIIENAGHISSRDQIKEVSDLLNNFLS